MSMGIRFRLGACILSIPVHRCPQQCVPPFHCYAASHLEACSSDRCSLKVFPGATSRSQSHCHKGSTRFTQDSREVSLGIDSWEQIATEDVLFIFYFLCILQGRLPLAQGFAGWDGKDFLVFTRRLEWSTLVISHKRFVPIFPPHSSTLQHFWFCRVLWGSRKLSRRLVAPERLAWVPSWIGPLESTPFHTCHTYCKFQPGSSHWGQLMVTSVWSLVPRDAMDRFLIGLYF